MLRASAHTTAQAVDLRAVTDRALDPLLTAGTELLAFVTAVIRNDSSLGPARTVLAASAGRYAVVRAAAVAGNFEMMNRVVDATGVPIGVSQRAIAADLGLDHHGKP